MSAPKIMVYKNNKKNDPVKKVISCRFILDFDLISRTDATLFQFGKEPVKFVCFVKDKTPSFLFSIRWHIFWRFKNICFGYTEKPINLQNFWRAKCTNPTHLDHYRRLNTRTKSIGSTTGSQTQTKE